MKILLQCMTNEPTISRLQQESFTHGKRGPSNQGHPFAIPVPSAQVRFLNSLPSQDLPGSNLSHVRVCRAQMARQDHGIDPWRIESFKSLDLGLRHIWCRTGMRQNQLRVVRCHFPLWQPSISPPKCPERLNASESSAGTALPTAQPYQIPCL